MKAVYIKEFGGVENLEYREVLDPPAPAGSKVLIRVRAAGLNRADLLQRRGLYPPPEGYSPNIPGLEFAGEIEQIGEHVSAFKNGDRVFGVTAGEAQAELLSIDSSLVTGIPDNLNFIEAAAVPEAFITAHDAAFVQVELKTGETLLIHAVGSGVGLAALQIANAIGVKVIGTSRTADKIERAKEFGLELGLVAENGNFADAVLDLTNGEGVDVVLDFIGAAYFEQNLKSLKMKGRMMFVGTMSGSKVEFDIGIAMRKRLTVKGTVLRARPTEEKAAAVKKFTDEVVPLLASGKIAPTVDKVFAASEVQEAHKYLESNESFGKVILEF